MSEPKVAVVIPFYRDSISAYESIALKQCAKILSAHTIIAIKPASLTLPKQVSNFPFAGIVDFDDSYFKNIQGYNRLMLSEAFYSRFLAYDYILIYQLDAFVFKDELMDWANKGYDYIGAPWLRKTEITNLGKQTILNLQYYLHTKYNLQKHGLPSKYQFENKVGNGGFSLRRVQKFHDLCIKFKPEIDRYMLKNESEFNEDSFWSVEVNRKQKQLNIPGYKTAIAFSFEHTPVLALKLNQEQLPFGCHAWDKNVEFWKPYFKALGYDI